MTRRSREEGDLGRPNDPPVLILTSLASGAKHGYALAKDIEQFAGVALGPGTLYGALTRLEERGFIEPVGEDERRRPYQITEPGQAALARVVTKMQAISSEAARRLGPGKLGAGHRGGVAGFAWGRL